MPSDIEIAQKARPLQIRQIATNAGIHADEIELYGNYKAKVSLGLLKRLKDRPNGRLISVTAITPTNAGEGKTCTAIGVTQALGRLKKKVILAIREPSLGPVFGIKGGACGGGYAQVIPMADINLHFTGDIHAVGSAHNLLAAIVDNHVFKGNELDIDPSRITWRRVMDISDRQLRNIKVGLGGKSHGFEHDSGFDITVASEIMAILALSKDIKDLKSRLGRIIVAYTASGTPVTAKELKCAGAMAVLLKDAIKPNLVQTLEGQPAFIHAGPFANIAHGNNSILATSMALKLADYVVTESGFGADLGAEKLFDIVCRVANFKPDVSVLVVSTRALKLHGGVLFKDSSKPNRKALEAGFANMERHASNIKKFGVNPIIAINKFLSDDDKELDLIKERCKEIGVSAVISEVVTKGGRGGVALSEEILSSIRNTPSGFKPIYPLNIPIKDKIETIAKEIYGADGVIYSEKAERDITGLTQNGFAKLPINMARTQLSFTDDPNVKGAPSGWKLNIREVKVSAGAGFIVPVTGDMMLMPGLPKHPAAENIDIDENGNIKGLF
ncbi:MAG: formate--tetrahydrofolate ligase [Candidatus Omnitrophica bacterium CG1_02_49_10]|nr:MAG: formate--tetrahydrofolate ligase [Candidatus Omnitrophica bacterium CG1_02_49_10]